MNQDDRKDPETLMGRWPESKKGRLKVYLGGAAGVGKTYRMLEEAHQLREQGHDASKLDLDANLFVNFNSFIDLALAIDRAVPEDCSAVRDDPGYKKLMSHKKIDAFNIIRSKMPPERGSAGDFSKASLDWRIASGYNDAVVQGIGKPKPVSTMVAQLKAKSQHLE